jgi:nucleoside-diphosphate kinase
MLVALKLLRLTKVQAEGFYYVHKQRPFFDSLCSFMSSGPIVVLALEGEDAIKRHRDLMGATDPAKAAEGTLRKAFGTHIEHNAVHGSDSPETAQFELGFFFNTLELPPR